MTSIESPPARVIYKAEYVNAITGNSWISSAQHETREEAEGFAREAEKEFGVSKLNRIVKFKEEVKSAELVDFPQTVPPRPGDVPIPLECAHIWDLRDQAIYRRGFADGMHRANNNVTPTVGDLEIRLFKATDLLRKAIAALITPSF